MDASKYPVTFGFNAKDGYYYGSNGVVAPFHHGEDRAMPTGVPIVVAGVTIALSGNTGATSGPHLHVDKRPTGSSVADRYAFLNPADWVNIKSAKVVFAGYAGTAGYVVSLQSNGYEYRFLHLSKINVKVGQTITLKKENDMYKGKSAEYWYKQTQEWKKREGLKNKAMNQARKALTQVRKDFKQHKATTQIEIARLDKLIKSLQAQPAVQSDDTKNLNALGTALKWFITRLGVK